MEINPERRRISLSMKAAAEELGFEIEVDESIQAEEKPARKKADKPKAEKAEAEAAPEAAEAPAAEAAAEPAEERLPKPPSNAARRAFLATTMVEGPAACRPFS